QLLHDVRTRWDSLFFMIRRYRVLRQAIEMLFRRPAHQKTLLPLVPTDAEWKKLRDFEVILQVPHTVQQVMSKQKTPVLSSAIPVYERFIYSWEYMAKNNPSLS
ncbi:hypothetical protein BT96DRAFT_786945, partial [Gymnopus androsaceus JB14]